MLLSLKEDITNLKAVSNRLLLLAQASMVDVEKKFVPLRLDHLLWDSKAELVRMHPENRVTINLDPELDDESNLQVFGDEQLLKGAIVNIMDNACKYSQDHHVTVNLRMTAGKTILEFKDKGVGIPSDQVTRLFEPFYRGSNVTGFKGVGIGLSLAYRIVKGHFGDIFVESQEGKGTKVVIHLPIFNSILSWI